MITLSKIKKGFKNPALYDLALTHRSWLNENPRISESNERLEFLGDAVLEYVVSSFLYDKLPDKEEGFLSALRSNIVNTKNLSEFAKNINIGDVLLLSKGEDAGGGKTNATLLANTVEAIIGAIYKDRGLAEAKKFIEENLLYDFDQKLASPLKDPKSLLQELIQSKGGITPKYRVIEERGPDHAKSFKIEVFVSGKALAVGSGRRKSDAEQSAAQKALQRLTQEVN